MLEQGNFAYGEVACFDYLKAYTLSKLLWNPNTDINDESHRFLPRFTAKKPAHS